MDKENQDTVIHMGKYEFTFRHEYSLGWSPGAREDEWPSGMDRMGMIFTRLVGILPATVHWKLPSGIEESRGPSDYSSGWSSGMVSSET